MNDLKQFSDNNDQALKRSLFIDLIRGFTVILMIIFHLSFDLNLFQIIQIDILHDPFWYAFPRLIVFLFFFVVGVGLVLSHSKKIKWKSFNKRLGLITFWALVISAVTYVLFPQNWIYFGTLHSIAVISVMSLPFIKHPRISLLVALALFIPSAFWDLNLPWPQLNHSSWDYISPFPWLGASLLGIFATHKGWMFLTIGENKLTNFISFLGRHSLVIYLIHQPILFGITALIAKVRS